MSPSRSAPPSLEVMIQYAKNDLASGQSSASMYVGGEDNLWGQVPIGEVTHDIRLELVYAVRAQRAGNLGPLLWACLISDTYWTDDEERAEQVSSRSGLSERFDAGDKSVYEALFAIRIDREGHEAYLLPYTRTQFGISWKTTREDPASADGVLLDLLSELVGLGQVPYDLSSLV